MHTILHTEVSHRGTRTVGFDAHVSLKLLIHFLDALHEVFVLHDLLLAVEAQSLEQLNGIVTYVVVEFGIEVAEKVACLVVPHPPQVVCNLVKSIQLFGKARLDG